MKYRKKNKASDETIMFLPDKIKRTRLNFKFCYFFRHFLSKNQFSESGRQSVSGKKSKTLGTGEGEPQNLIP